MEINDEIQNFREELIYGQGGRRGAEHRAEIAHERELAALRMHSRALVWAGSLDELTRTIARWYESGWIVARDLQEALQTASMHFVGPDGMQIIASAQATPKPKEDAVSPSMWPLLKYQSEIKKAIFGQLAQNHDATAGAICHSLDAVGAVELPESWKSKPDDWSFFRAYSDPSRRGRIQKSISGIRADMRRAGLLPRK